ncbi:MAG: hypothetical protein APF76_00400 [Desulfitibacter sp. BRH_c19]|nr:MAG: hypothetical protein APF76_00400 [Desulfitibacter sp. BRH_c19]
MIVYVYDGTFPGLLTSIYEAYYRDEKPERISKTWDFQNNLFSKPIIINTDDEKADKVYNAIGEKISFNALKNIYYAFLAEIKNSDTLIYNYVRLGFKLGKIVDGNYSNETVFKFQEICKKVGKEKHRVLGIMRFRLLQKKIYYGPIEPDHNIIALLAPHFAKRMADQDWIIHDLRRKIAIVYNQSEWVMTDLEINNPLLFDAEEMIYQSVWKKYFEKIAIKERKNTRLQKQCMPSRYWKHLVEIYY